MCAVSGAVSGVRRQWLADRARAAGPTVSIVGPRASSSPWAQSPSYPARLCNLSMGPTVGTKDVRSAMGVWGRLAGPYGKRSSYGVGGRGHAQRGPSGCDRRTPILPGVGWPTAGRPLTSGEGTTVVRSESMFESR